MPEPSHACDLAPRAGTGPAASLWLSWAVSSLSPALRTRARFGFELADEMFEMCSKIILRAVQHHHPIVARPRYRCTSINAHPGTTAEAAEPGWAPRNTLKKKQVHDLRCSSTLSNTQHNQSAAQSISSTINQHNHSSQSHSPINQHTITPLHNHSAAQSFRTSTMHNHSAAQSPSTITQLHAEIMLS